MKDLNAFEVLLDVREFKRWTLQMKKNNHFLQRRYENLQSIRKYHHPS